MKQNMATRLQSEAFEEAGIEHANVEIRGNHTFRLVDARRDQLSDIEDQIVHGWHSQVNHIVGGSKPHLVDVYYCG